MSDVLNGLSEQSLPLPERVGERIRAWSRTEAGVRQCARIVDGSVLGEDMLVAEVREAIRHEMFRREPE